jgi:predicted nucleic acid-binding protein
VYLLDTNVVSEMRRISAGHGDAQVSLWLGQVDDSTLYLSAITVLELELGCLSMARRDTLQSEVLRRWLRGLLRHFYDRVVPIDSFVATRAAALHVPNARETHDALIAATALTHRFAVVTRNVGDFSTDGLEVINPWSFSAGTPSTLPAEPDR